MVNFSIVGCLSFIFGMLCLCPIPVWLNATVELYMIILSIGCVFMGIGIVCNAYDIVLRWVLLKAH